MPENAYIFDAVRTPRSKGKTRDGSLAEVKPIDLGATVLNALKSRQGFNSEHVDDVIFGCVTPVGDQGSNIAKTTAMHAGWSEAVAGFQLDRFCGSGLEACNIAAQKVLSGWANLIVAGGVESMSRAPMGSNGGAFLFDPQFKFEQLSVPQGIGADLIATLDGYSRITLDTYALESQRRAAYAREQGHFTRSVVPVNDLNGAAILAHDDFIKPDTSLESLANLSPAFKAMGEAGLDDMALSRYTSLAKIEHGHTAGNSSGIVDGAAAVLIGNEQAKQEYGLTPRARIVMGAVTANDPVIMLTAPGPSAQQCLAMAGMDKTDIDLWEINEAFASVALRYMRDLDIDHDITNVNGGAIALGHPLGATGAMLLGTMLDELERRDLQRGMVSLCIGGGMGISTIIERV